MGNYFHSVKLDEEKCKGCTNCIKKCPTEAIRVRKGKARIINERCIDCGECIRVCPHHAKKAVSDPMEIILDYKYKIAIPAPSLYGQFKTAQSRNHVLNALKKLGFDDVFEVARAAEIVSDATKKLLKSGDIKKPLISSACPAIVRLIQVRFPNLIDNIVKIESPMEVAAGIVKNTFSEKLKLPVSDIGVFFITPCAAKVTSVKAPYERNRSFVDGVISIKDIYIKVINNLTRVKELEPLEQAGYEGIRWANSGGESLALGTDQFLAVDGIHNVITILEEVENERLEDVDFIEALGCTGGCLGGALTVENVYVAKTRLKKFIDQAKEQAHSHIKPEEIDDDLVWTEDFKYNPVLKLDVDMLKAMRKLENMESISKGFPGLDCGACGAPSCRALAEDIVRGNAKETDCLFKFKDRLRNLVAQIDDITDELNEDEENKGSCAFNEGN